MVTLSFAQSILQGRLDYNSFKNIHVPFILTMTAVTLLQSAFLNRTQCFELPWVSRYHSVLEII